VHIQLHHLNKIATHVTSANCYCSHLPLEDFVFGEGGLSGTTPLILACKNGELDVVKHLIEIWQVNVDATAKYSTRMPNSNIDLETKKASPLFVAAIHGHSHVVRYLLKKGADVSVKTCDEIENGISRLDGLTPLYGAIYQVLWCYRPSLEHQQEIKAVVLSLLEYGANPNADSFDGQPMWKNITCGVDAITALIHHGLDLKQRIPKTGETLLHHVLDELTDEESLAIVKLLVEKGADLLARDIHGFTPLLKAASNRNVDGHLSLATLDFLLEREEYGRMEKIQAMELAGATVLLEPGNAQYFPKASHYWNRALHLRYPVEMAEELSSSFEKILVRKIRSHVESTTLDELHQLMLHPENYRIQALFVKLRTFDCIIRRLDPAPVRNYFWMAADVIKLVSTLSTLQDNHPSLLNFEKLKTSVDLILLVTDQSPVALNNGEHLRYIEGHVLRDENYYGSQFKESLLHLLEMFFRLPEILDDHNTASLTRSLRLLGPHRLGILLLPACRKLSNLKALALVRVLLEAGADPNVDVDRLHENASLHVVAGMSDRKLGDAACLLLVEFGAKLHQVNKAGKTALDIWIHHNETDDKWNEEAGGWSARPEWCCPLPSLLRLAARVVRVHKIPYADGKTPAILHPLIQLR